MDKKAKLLTAILEKKNHNDTKTLMGKSYIQELSVELLRENPFQPRLHIEEKELKDLATSIKRDGLLQPIPVAKMTNSEEGFQYVVIAGHRRLEAHRYLELATIKVILLENISKKDLASLALVENVQREELNYIELAMQYKTLLDNKIFNSIVELSDTIGKDPGDVGKVLNLLKLSPKIIDDVKLNKTTKDLKILSAIRTLKSYDIQEEVYDWFIEGNESRRNVLQRVQELKNETTSEDNTNYEIDNSEKSCIIKLPSLSLQQQEKIQTFINKLLK